MNNDNLFGGMPKDNDDNNSGTQMPNNNFTEPNSGFVNRTVLPNQGINNTINNNTFSVNQQANNANMPYGNQQNFNGNMPYGNQQNYNVNQNINMPNGNNYGAGNTREDLINYWNAIHGDKGHTRKRMISFRKLKNKTL